MNESKRIGSKMIESEVSGSEVKETDPLCSIVERTSGVKGVLEAFTGTNKSLENVTVANARLISVAEFFDLADSSKECTYLKIMYRACLEGIVGVPPAKETGSSSSDSVEAESEMKSAEELFQPKLSDREAEILKFVQTLLQSDPTVFGGAGKLWTACAPLSDRTTVKDVSDLFGKINTNSLRLDRIRKVDLRQCSLMARDMPFVTHIVDIIAGRVKEPLTVVLRGNRLRGGGSSERGILDIPLQMCLRSAKIKFVDICLNGIASIDRKDFFATLGETEFERLVFIYESHLHSGAWKNMLSRKGRDEAKWDKMCETVVRTHTSYYGDE